MKSEVTIKQKFRIVRVKDGFVDLNKFEIKIWDSELVFKVIRDENEKPNKR